VENLGASSQFSGAAMRHATGDERPLRAGHVEPQVAFTRGGKRKFAAKNTNGRSAQEVSIDILGK